MRRGAARWNVSAANAAGASASSSAILGVGGNRKQHEREDDTEQVFHLILLNVAWE
jgi:hypothetical protein